MGLCEGNDVPTPLATPLVHADCFRVVDLPYGVLCRRNQIQGLLPNFDESEPDVVARRFAAESHNVRLNTSAIRATLPS